MMTPFEAGEIFLALRLHFTRDSYDYLKYHGKTRLTPESFARRSDKFIFAKLARIYSTSDEFRDFVIANCLFDQHLYSRTLLVPEARERFLAYRKVHESLSYICEQECRVFFETQPGLDAALHTRSNCPPLLTAVWQKKVSLETFLSLNRVLEFLPVWERHITDTIKWPVFLHLCRKYDPFLTVNTDRTTKMLRELLTK